MAEKQCVLSFDGQDDCVNLGRKPEYKVTKTITLEAWINVAAQKQWAGIITNIYDTGGAESGYGLLLDGGSGFYFGLKLPSSGINYPYTTEANTIKLNQWHHIAGTYDGQQMKLYVDGVEKIKKEIAANSIDYSIENDLRLGMYKDNDEFHAFPGKITEVRLWNVARSAEEIKATMNQRLQGNEVGLVGYWPLNECSGEQVTDKTGKGNNGTINGATWVQEELPFKAAPEQVNKIGKIVVNGDEWTLSNDGIKGAPDAAVFATNIAKWFAGDRPGKFHAYSTNFGLTGSVLAETMQKAGHTWTVGINISWDIATLLTYDGIFVGGDVADNQVLIDYVKADGNVYVMAGTGWGGAQGEANHWNPFLNAFGFNLVGEYNGIYGNQPVSNSHPILAGVKELFQNNSNSIVNLDTTSGKNQLIVTHSSGQGLIATFEGTPETTPPPTTIDEGDPEEVVEEFIKGEETGTATGTVAIAHIAYKGKVKRTQSDEYVEIVNKGTETADISGWKVSSGLSKKQSFTFPAGTKLEAGKSFRVYTNEVHPETGGFSLGSGSGIWNDKGDEAKLFDAQGNQVSTLAYGASSIPGIKTELGVPQLTVKVSPSGINKQMAMGSKVTFVDALKLAIQSFLEDDTEIESPLGQMLNDPGAFGLPQGADKAAATKVLRSYLNQPTSTLTLQTAKSQYPPENGEKVDTNWIFLLELKEISGLYWAIVDRSGTKAAYNYGVS